MADPARARKLADRIREIAAETLERRVKDPRLGFVTVTDARITGDLRDATVFYTVYGDEEERSATAAALESVKGLVRSEVGRRTGVRYTPTLEFVADAIPENAANIDDLLRTARESDERVAQTAAEAEYAGDPDPYRKPADDEDEDDVDESEEPESAEGDDTRGDPDGLVVVDKPTGWTSHDVVARIRRLAGTRRVGHAGTLDPMATGVLVVGVGKATKLLGHLALTEKEYDATIRLGASTVTDDAEGEVTTAADASAVTPDAVAAGVAALTGPIQQVPSAVSAVKIDGVRSYHRVRSGEDVELPPRSVVVSRFDVLASRHEGEYLDLDVSVSCSSGTYIRALARDLGASLGVGGHLTMLRRTAVGPYRLDAARTLDQLTAEFTLLPLADAAAVAFPRLDVDAETAGKVAHGMPLPATGLGPGPVAVFGPDGTLLSLAEDRGSRAKHLAVFV